MSATVSLTQTQIFTALRTVLETFGLTGEFPYAPIPIIRGQVNRVPEPACEDFVVLWPIARDRLTLNVDNWIDSTVTGSMTANVLTVTAVGRGKVLIGSTVYGTGVPTGLIVRQQLTGTANGIGTYAVTPQTNPVTLTSQPFYVGTLSAMQETEITIQADVHGPCSADNAARISTLFRDQYTCSAFQQTGMDIAPLYTSNPRQMPFENGEQQTEERWVIDLCMQANVTITTTMQFADQLEIATTNIEAAFPA